uniref:Uncharacterized protein n=1 Tax=Rhizophora mucronata TaxID=61149 RepID=A0A2P2IQY9_RHIMU
MSSVSIDPSSTRKTVDWDHWELGGRQL